MRSGRFYPHANTFREALRDLQVMSAYADRHRVLPWAQLRNALVDQGMSPQNAEAMIFWSPLLRRTTHGYALL
jgi:hypothetical protein